jgi:hypothetical protein
MPDRKALHPQAMESTWMFTYDWDGIFFGEYREFLKRIKRIAGDVMDDLDLEEYFEPALIVELLFAKLKKDETMETDTVDRIYSDFRQPHSDKLLEELYRLLRLNIYPIGLEELARELPDTAYVVELVMDREDECFRYMFEDDK